jgi:hypothetical protein
MARGSAQTSQRQRTKANPQLLGSFNQTSLRYLTGSLGPEYIVGLNGYGGGTMNHWYGIHLQVPAWIITRKGGPRPNYIQVSAYDLNYNPIQGRTIFQADSGQATNSAGTVYYPYLGQVAGSQSILYNNFNPDVSLTKDDFYYVLSPGNYLLCVSSTRNEPLDYSLGLAIEVAVEEMFLLLEDLTGSFLTCESEPGLEDKFIIEVAEGYSFDSDYEHSLSEWTQAWRRERSPDDALPEIFLPLISKP